MGSSNVPSTPRSEGGRGPRRAVVAASWRDSGQATAETAVVIPSLVLLTAMLLWGLLAAAAHIQCVDAARAGARAAARAEPWPRVMEAAKEVAPAEADVEVRRDQDLVRVRVRARSVGPGPLSIELRAEAVAQVEEHELPESHTGRREAPDRRDAPERRDDPVGDDPEKRDAPQRGRRDPGARDAPQPPGTPATRPPG